MKTILLLTGMSGSGKSSALRFLEDLGYEVIDNLPLMLFPQITKLTKLDKPLAIGIDARTHGFDPAQLLEKMKQFQGGDDRLHLLFLECDVEIIQKRYRETRRHHPLTTSQGSVHDGILKEKQLLQGLKNAANTIIDTSFLTPPELKEQLRVYFDPSDAKKRLTIMLLSFAFPKGAPREADFLFDMRFLKNPFYLESLKPLTGQSIEIQNYLKKEENFHYFSNGFKTILKTVLPCFRTDGRALVTLGFGCTGGKHRSVFATEFFGDWLKKEGYMISIYHRDLKND